MNYSKQRELVLKTLQENMIHPTADQVYELMRKEMPKISLATVYRNLNQLAEKGIIRRISGLNGSVHFDHDIEKHYHSCGSGPGSKAGRADGIGSRVV